MRLCVFYAQLWMSMALGRITLGLFLGRSEGEAEGSPTQRLQQSPAPVTISIFTLLSFPLRIIFVRFSLSCRSDSGTAPTPVDVQNDNEKSNGTEG